MDPKVMDQNAACIFISHAHADHLPLYSSPPAGRMRVVCSKATARLFRERRRYSLAQMDCWSNEEFSIETVPGGHTFDSTIAVINDLAGDKKIVYTGDVNIEDRGFLKGYTPIKCDILILEATYGEGNYNFPPFEEQMKLARDYVQGELEKGHPVALLGYALGKAQVLNYCLGDLSENRFSQASIWKMEQIHRELGLELYETKCYSEALGEDSLQKSEPWLLFYTHTSGRNATLARLRKKFGLKIVGFSGWARNKMQYKYRMAVDEGFIVSDHSDYNSLKEIIRKSNPEKIFTIFGSAEKLARELQREGFNAVPLKECQSTLDSFF